MSDKPVRAFPSLYATIYPVMMEVAKSLGYALALHGTLNRDMDVIAVAWTDDAVSAEELAAALSERLGAFIGLEGPNETPHRKPRGRVAWSLPLTGGAYIDLSVIVGDHLNRSDSRREMLDAQIYHANEMIEALPELYRERLRLYGVG